MLVTLEKKGLSEGNLVFFFWKMALYEIRLSLVNSHEESARKLFHFLSLHFWSNIYRTPSGKALETYK